jgi:DUF971 family protein
MVNNYAVRTVFDDPHEKPLIDFYQYKRVFSN